MTELRWDGKYDADGKKCAPLKIALPFQTVETVNESAQDRQKALDMFSSPDENGEWRNRLIWGDKKYVLPSLLPEFAGKVDLIYIDPPFDTGANFSFTATIPAAPETTPLSKRRPNAAPADDPDNDDPDASPENPPSSSLSFTKEPSILEQKAYRDTWGKGLDSYLKWFYETAVLLRELLSEKGSIAVHLNAFMAPYCRAIMDEVFGVDNYRNAVIVRRGMKSLQNQFETIQSLAGGYDVVTLYSKNAATRYPKLTRLLDERRLGTWNGHWRGTERPTMRYPILGLSAPNSGQYRWSKQRSDVAVENYNNYLREAKGNMDIDTYYKDYLDRTGEGLDFLRLGSTGRPEHYVPPTESQLASDIWMNVSTIGKGTGYPTEKHEDLLDEVITWLSNPGDLVLDCFCGSGTTAAVSEKLGRRWITCDLGRFAIHTARKRLLAIPNVKPFVVQNLGKYERQHWQIAEFGDAQTAAKREAAYRSFILDLYRARPLSGALYLHGVKGDRRVFVGGVDSPVSLGDLKNISTELKKTMGTGADAPTSMSVDILGWDFAFDLNETGKAAMQDAGINARFVRIPREVLERKAVEQGDIKFFELAALEADVKVVGKTVSVTLSDFVMPTDDVPHEVQTAITHWSQWIDYWAVDWDNKNDTFHNEWQDYRTRKKRDLQYRITHPYEEPGTYQIVIKVIDILGNDTTKTVPIVI